MAREENLTLTDIEEGELCSVTREVALVQGIIHCAIKMQVLYDLDHNFFVNPNCH